MIYLICVWACAVWMIAFDVYYLIMWYKADKKRLPAFYVDLVKLFYKENIPGALTLCKDNDDLQFASCCRVMLFARNNDNIELEAAFQGGLNSIKDEFKVSDDKELLYDMINVVLFFVVLFVIVSTAKIIGQNVYWPIMIMFASLFLQKKHFKRKMLEFQMNKQYLLDFRTLLYGSLGYLPLVYSPSPMTRNEREIWNDIRDKALGKG
jgi:hypothetical protein